MSDTGRPPGLQTRTAPEKPRPYEPPAIEWEEQIDVKANLASACEKFSESGDCQDLTTS